MSEEENTQAHIPEKYQGFVDHISGLSVLELHELVKTLEKVFDVSAAAALVAAPGARAGEGESVEEKSIFTVELTDVGGQKIAVIKAVKEALGLGLKEAKDLVDGAPSELKKDVKKEDAEQLKGKIEAAGAKVTLK